MIFDEADRRDPDHARTWIALVDGNNHQIDRIEREARARDVDLTIVIHLVHVLEYLWRAAWSFFPGGDPAAEAWVADKATAVLNDYWTFHVARERQRIHESRYANNIIPQAA